MGIENASLKTKNDVWLYTFRRFPSSYSPSSLLDWRQKLTIKILHPSPPLGFYIRQGWGMASSSMDPSCVVLVWECLMCDHWHCRSYHGIVLTSCFSFSFPPRCGFLYRMSTFSVSIEVLLMFILFLTTLIIPSRHESVLRSILGELMDLNFAWGMFVLEYISPYGNKF
jgi:hypothetical protein